ncbi:MULTISPECIES: HU family DNA-binding protein [Bartonella]|uniref:Bacterial nucleoid protein Hbs n=3 Tax=Bartonella TaxID=773 RepID=E6YYK9_BARSR|nr:MULTISPECIES: HU family DNA-binding protein [Bartonella]AQX19531.1 bacterial nucleoid protein Hbs [Bartonella sp. WD16.2]AQX30484.1 bacterial nucleoid protein Hbs [Bartonella schoenbuchensis R1]MBA9082421.1 DNA-binding protein HU-beta [Bartonella chomelii]CBI82020.1 DNA-binding protein [Bartonella schoenbuchensis R1]CDP79960.1 DNA-binding protein [Bartonella schoenbuchensis]
MNKSELVNSIAEKAGVSKAQAGSILDAFIASVTEALASGGDVRLPGFGSFEVSKRAATKGRNPSTGVEIHIPARSVPKFSAGKSLKEAVNKK